VAAVVRDGRLAIARDLEDLADLAGVDDLAGRSEDGVPAAGAIDRDPNVVFAARLQDDVGLLQT